MAEQLIEIEAEDEYSTPKSGLLDDQEIEVKKFPSKFKKKRKLVELISYALYCVNIGVLLFKGLEDLSRELQI